MNFQCEFCGPCGWKIKAIGPNLAVCTVSKLDLNIVGCQTIFDFSNAHDHVPFSVPLN